jgi:2,4-dienoyl-CoA reductase-like NADH-dependent reductase (Old Yellow Enzyme family)
VIKPHQTGPQPFQKDKIMPSKIWFITGISPLTRMRAGPIDHVPTALQAEYYAQRASASLIVAEATAISPFARPYIANPDLVERLATGAPLAEIDWTTVYAAGPRGYSDYPTLRHATA